MQKASRLQGKWRNLVLPLTALLIVIADQLSKLWISTNLAVGESLPELDFPHLTHVQNTGAAFGLFRGQVFPLTIVALVGVAVILVYAFIIYRRYPFWGNRLVWVGLGLVFGGTVGNLIDRLHLGYVTDFIDFGFWPAFNLADSAVVVGVIIFAYSLLPLTRADKD
jgi:signal peptidase II